MSDFKVDASQLKRLDRSLTKAGKDYKKGVKRFLKEIGHTISGLAKKYSPESPTMRDYKNMNQDGETTRANTSITSGSLRDSITYDTGKDFVSIGVPVNSRAGKYAERIHDGKGKTWHERGVRTKQKGSKADEKYITRAGDDSAKEIDALIDKVIKDLTNGIGI